MLRDGRFRWSAGILAALLTVSLTSGYIAQRTAREERDSAQAQMQSMWYQQPAKNPHSAAHYGLWAFKPMPALSFAERGIDPFVGNATYLEAHRQNDFRFRPAMDATAAQRFGDWSASAILQQLVPLLIIVLGFTAFAGEREQGTLRQLASLGVPAHTLIAGKSVGIAAALSIVLVPASIAGAGALLLAAGADRSDPTRFAALALVYLGWFAIVLASTMIVSLLARTAQRALLVLLGLWTFNALVAPRLAASLARSAHPTPSRVEFIAAVDQGLATGIDGHAPAGERRKELETALLTKYNVTSTKDLPDNFEAVAMQASEEHGDEVFDHNFNVVYDRFRQQAQVQQVASLVAPMLAVRFLSMGIAGTDLESHRSFASAAEQYRRTIQREMNGWLAKNTKEGATFSVRADSALWAQVPEFTYQSQSVSASLRSLAVCLVALGAWLLASCAWLSTRKQLSVV